MAVAGGGVLGLSVAALAAVCGARVSVFEPEALGDNASGVAAGMLSPALEAALDADEADGAMLREGYDAWPAFAEALGLQRPAALAAGALYIDTPDALDRMQRRLSDLGARPQRCGAWVIRDLQPDASPAITDAIHLAADGRVDATRLLVELTHRLEAAGGQVIRAACPASPGPEFDAVVIAAGYESRRWMAAAPELAVLQPIKGQVLHFAGGAASGATLRSQDGYAAPRPGGPVMGATMEPGRDDREVEATAVERLRTTALALMPALIRTPFVARAGVRAATPDGRPLVGRSESGLWLATGVRRNGWLLAPIVASAMVDLLAGAPAIAAFDPTRVGAMAGRDRLRPF